MVGVIDDDAVDLSEVAVALAVEVFGGFVLVFQAQIGNAFAIDAVNQHSSEFIDVLGIGFRVELARLLPVEGELGLARTRAENGADVFITFLLQRAIFVVHRLADADLLVQFERAFTEIERRTFVMRRF